jgi:uncharacterized protein YegJ (DUF2314 family)
MYKSLQFKAFLIVCLFLTTSCGSPASPPLSGTPITDEEFNAAVEDAHGTLNILREALLSPKASYSFVGLKVRFKGRETFEDMWTELIDYYDGSFTIRMIVGVTVERGLNADRFVTVSSEDVLDWMILEEDGKLIGGYTIRLSYEHMMPEEREEFLRVTGYQME